jgi:SAM-dependent methyltransferase
MHANEEHWNGVYGKRSPTEVSWYQAESTLSLELLSACNAGPVAPVIDIGAGASTLVDGLLARGYRDITLLDISERALEETRRRLGEAAVSYLVADITCWKPERSYRVWHDRAVFHFLTDSDARRAYRDALTAAVSTGGHVVLGTFALDGPERCSGLPVQRYSSESLAHEFEGVLRLVEARADRHRTPSGSEQSFTFVRFERA